MYGVQHETQIPVAVWDQQIDTNSSHSLLSEISDMAIDMTLENIMDRKRIRTKTACDYCRKRKSKCNGECPCSCCITHKRDCMYTVVPRERKKRVSKVSIAPPSQTENVDTGSLKQLTSRLSALENVLSKISGKLDSTSISDEEAALMNSTNNYSMQTTKEPESNLSSALTLVRSIPLPRLPLVVSNYIQSTRTLKEMLNSESGGECCQVQTFFGSHSIFNSFSVKSMNWFKTMLLTNDKIMIPLKNLPAAFNNAFDYTTKMWVEQKDLNMESQVKTFFTLEHKNLVFEILENYYHSIHLVCFVCSIDTIREIFQIYFYGISQDYHSANKLKSSDFLIMNAIIALCLCNYDETQHIDSQIFPKLSMTSPEELKLLKESCYQNAIHTYFKVSMKLDGIKTVQGIGLLLLYFDANYVTDIHLNYTLTSVMIRYAQEMGLDRLESLDMVPADEEREVRRRLLWFCMHVDIETCYRNGKSTLLNFNDLSTLTELDDHFLSVPVDPFQGKLYETNCQNIISNSQAHGSQYYYAYFTLLLNRIKAKSYNKLYGRAAFLKTDQLLDNLEELNKEMFALAELMEPEVRPTLHYVAKENRQKSRNAQFNTLFLMDQKFKYEMLMFQISFFSHMSLINRLPFIRSINEQDERYVNFGNLSLESTRTVLHLVSNVDVSNTPNTVLSWLAFYPFLSYGSLLANCIVFTTEEKLHNDCLLLIKTSMNFFASKHSERSIRNWNQSKTCDVKITILDLITRVLLRVLINFMDKASPHDYCKEIDGLAEHLIACQGIYPDLFKDSTDLEKPLNLLFMSAMRSPSRSECSSSSSCPSSVSSFDSDEKMDPVNFPDLQMKDLLNFDEFNEDAFSSLLYSLMYNNANAYVEKNEDRDFFL